MLQVVCDLTIASDNARFGQAGPKVGSFDGGFGSSYLARCVGQKKAREIWFLCRQYTAAEALEMGMVNKVVPLERLEDEAMEWCDDILKRSPMAIRMIKRALNAELDGQHGLMELAGDATLMFYMMAEAQEGKNAFLEKRDPNFDDFPASPDECTLPAPRPAFHTPRRDVARIVDSERNILHRAHRPRAPRSGRHRRMCPVQRSRSRRPPRICRKGGRAMRLYQPRPASPRPFRSVVDTVWP